MTERETSDTTRKWGICYRGHGRAIHRATHEEWTRDGKTFKSINAFCNRNGQWTGHSFREMDQEGITATVTCNTCNAMMGVNFGKAPAVANEDSCTAIRKSSGKQCTYKAIREHSCNIHFGADVERV